MPVVLSSAARGAAGVAAASAGGDTFDCVPQPSVSKRIGQSKVNGTRDIADALAIRLAGNPKPALWTILRSKRAFRREAGWHCRRNLRTIVR